MFVDTHAHLFYKNFNNDLDAVIQRAKEAKVDYILIPSTDILTARDTLKLIDAYDIIYGAVGVHPHDTKDWDKNSLNKIEELASNEKVAAIGEIGLDYYYDYSPRETQIKAFREQLDLGLKLNKPVIIHNREAGEDLMRIVSDYCGSGLKAQFHCFNGSAEMVKELIAMHHFISFCGNITFKKADELQKTLKSVSLEHLLLETDSPFLTPVPFRGKRNEPSYIKYTAGKIAEIHNITIEDVARITSLNAFRMFGIGSLPQTSFTYKINNSLYINITNRCNADCVFCRRKEEPFIKGYNLKMNKNEEPGAEIYIKEIGDPARFSEIVFCGFGEPTLRWNVVKEVAGYVKSRNGRTRLDTNGHGNFINKRDITPELKGIFDTVSVSLNNFDPQEYAETMQVDPAMFDEAVSFARNAKNYVENIIVTAVSYNNIDVGKAGRFAEEKIGAEFRLREYF